MALTKREKELLSKIIYNEGELDEKDEDGYYSSKPFIVENFTKDEILENFDMFIHNKAFIESKMYRDIVLDYIDKMDELVKNIWSKQIPTPDWLGIDDIIKLLDHGFLEYTSKRNFTEKCFLTFNHKSQRENLLKYKDCFDWEYIFNKFSNGYRFELCDTVIETCADKLNPLIYLQTLPLVEQLYKLNDKKEDAYYLSKLVDRVEKFNTITNDIYSKDTIEHLLRETKYMVSNEEYVNITDYDVESDSKPYSDEDIKQKYVKLFEPFSDQYIYDNFELFNIHSLAKAGRVTEKLLVKYLESDKFIYLDRFLCNNNRELSYDFLIKYYKRFSLREIWKQKNILKAYKNKSIEVVEPCKIYLYNEFLTEEDLKYLSNTNKFNIYLPMEYGDFIEDNHYIKDEKLEELARERYKNYLKSINLIKVD